MTVRKLIEKLQVLNQDARVVVNGYEGGFGDVREESVKYIDLALNIHKENYYSPHDYWNHYSDYEKVTCVVIER